MEDASALELSATGAHACKAGDARPAKPRFSLTTEQRDFVASSPLVFVMSGAPDAPPDVSPRGDGPGFVRIVDDSILHLPDRVGNNRVDTIRNAVQAPDIILAFLKAQDERVLVVEGAAIIRTDPHLLALHSINGRAPRSVMEIEVRSARLQSHAAVNRSKLWHPDAIENRFSFSFGAVLAEQMGGGADAAATEELVADDYKSQLY
ncbi:pyridoxamine 5'-phosphate oxidase family protein [Pseudaminobacter salicylatoxidans]|uniref:pyridoxamine 5'-phosphate oxidase family protein n=1 Tax=Pseudaminobacter salicylatoxidans TaxID=93369 RepID=UPI00031FEAE3|nr:pyridoxamine 5'-phosphate oxidase family protein [Pseudaminobacter salicylatoxidans]